MGLQREQVAFLCLIGTTFGFSLDASRVSKIMISIAFLK